jgi:hypothetical protein
MKAFTAVASFFTVLVAVLPGVLGGAITPGEVETVLTVSDTTLNIGALKSRQVPIPSLTLCQSSNCGGPCYTYYLGELGKGCVGDSADFLMGL